MIKRLVNVIVKVSVGLALLGILIAPYILGFATIWFFLYIIGVV